MDSDLKWIVGIGLSLTLGMITTLIAAFRNLANKISISNRDLYLRIDRVKEQYVRRDDLDGHLKRLGEEIHELRSQLAEQSKQSREQSDRVIEAIKALKLINY